MRHLRKFLHSSIIIILFLVGIPAYGELLIDFEDCVGSGLLLYSEDGAEISPNGDGTISCANTNCPNSSTCPISSGNPNPSLRIDFPILVSEVSVDLGDQASDSETLFINAFNANNNLVDSAELFITATDQSMHTLKVSGEGITYVVTGSFGGISGSSVFIDNIRFVPQFVAVGGESIPINAFSLFLVSIENSVSWILLLFALSSIVLILRKIGIFNQITTNS